MVHKEHSGVHVLQPEGELTIFEAAMLHEALCALYRNTGLLELDLSDVERVDTSGVQLILAAVLSGRLTVSGMSSTVAEQIKMIGCHDWINPKETEHARHGA